MQKVNLSKLSKCLIARNNCKASKHSWQTKWEQSIDEICEDLPSGSGIDSGVKFEIDKSTPEKLVFSVPFHHMDENGYYDGWTTYKITVKPSFWQGFDLKITGRDKNWTKNYLYDLFNKVFSLDGN